ncbi:hypothetical protein [Pseudomonas sp.]|uniref:hypothetical protein n=1 Tax=Pseudomonas sp. TaxID=306 RepID=UPI0027332DA6|nr:hypothetical protein [Pseudomonas sp.]MDP3815969.1 hypothetical protein [Pseudomonas sp.]
MICTRSLALLLTLLSLVACDQAPVPQPAPQPKPPKTESAKPLPAAPEVEPAPVKPAAVAKPVEPPVPAPQPVAKAAAPAVVAKPKSQPKPKPPATVSKSVPLEPKAPLDLSLPAEVFEQLQPLEPLDDLPATLLPPLFVEKTEPTSPFQLNGKLITNERSDDYWDSLEGAELQFEFKQ